MLADRLEPDDTMAEMLYRERFGLSSKQMAEEPADTVEYWLILESTRKKRARRQAK